MRGLLLAAGAIMLLAGLWPALALAASVIDSGSGLSPRAAGAVSFAAEDGGPLLAILARSAAWAFGCALLGALLAWPAARVCRASRGHLGRGWMTLVLLVPLALPPWLLSTVLWLSCGPGTSIGDMAERGDAMTLVRRAVLLIALVAWSGSVAFAVHMLGTDDRDRRDTQLMALDRAGVLARVRGAFARDRFALMIGVLAAGTFLVGETMAFDLAQVSTYGFELRSRDALGAPASEIVSRALPAILLAAGAVALLAWIGPRALARSRGSSRASRESSGAQGAAGGGFAGMLAALVAWTPLAMVLLLGVLFARSMASVPRVADFLALHGDALRSTLVASALAAALVALCAVAVRLGANDRSALVRRATLLAALFASAWSLAPATVVAIALEAAYNHGPTAWIYDTPLIVVLALVARALVVAAIVGVLLARRSPPHAGALRALDGQSARAAWLGWRWEGAIAAGVGCVLALAWSLGELTASGRVLPPGMHWLATDILNAIHYQRPDTVLLATLALLLAALVGAACLALALGARILPRRRGALGTTSMALVAATLAGGALVVPVGCTRPGAEPTADPLAIGAPKVEKPLEIERTLAGVGRGPGQFNGPRVLATDPRSGRTYVIDKDARVQRFDAGPDPVAEWRMPKFDRGRPVGATVAPDGSLLVADTHEHRVVAFSPDGQLLWEFGSYGLEPGQFIYPTDIAVAPDGRLFVAEYGGNDRIQVFGPDRRLLYGFGVPGAGPGQFIRPQSLAYDAARDELYVLEVGNHRVQVVKGDGEFVRILAGPGKGVGELSYPFGLVLEIGGDAVTSAMPDRLANDADSPRTVVVVEHASHRLQRLDARTGKVLAVAGGIGAEPGRLKYPWALESAGAGPDGRGRLAVCDHGNSRIQFFEFPMSEDPRAPHPTP